MTHELILHPNMAWEDSGDEAKSFYAGFKKYPKIKKEFKLLLTSKLEAAFPLNYLQRGLTLQCGALNSLAENVVIKRIKNLKAKKINLFKKDKP